MKKTGKLTQEEVVDFINEITPGNVKDAVHAGFQAGLKSAIELI